MKRFIVLVGLILAVSSFTSALSPERVASTTTTFTSNNTFTFTTQPDYRMGELTANFSWLPRETPSQDINVSVTNGRLVGDTVTVTRAAAEDFTTSIDAHINVRRDEPEIDKRVTFPFTADAQEEVEQRDEYLQENELIRITPEIRSLSSNIAENTTDLRRVVDRVAEWTATNIEYNLSSTNAEASIPSDQVLKQRNGVCDEITNLFIAQMRSLGIPARYVSGIAYTDSKLFTSDWGAHGWAEVYFPGHGWVPYDPTYKQFGYVDGTHIVFAKGTGGDKYGTQYQWRANGVDVDYDRSWDVRLDRNESRLRTDVDFSLRPGDQTIGYGQANRVDMTIINNDDHYQTVAARLYPTEKVSYTSPRLRTVTLAPNEERNVSWYLTISDDFQDGYQYTLPVTGSIDGVEEQTSFAALDAADTTVEPPRTTSSPEYDCQTTKNSYYEGDNVTISCETTKPTRLCIDDTCSRNERNPSVTTTAPQQSTTKQVRLPGYDATPYVTVPVKAQATVNDANLTYHTATRTARVTTDITNRFAVETLTLQLTSSTDTSTTTLDHERSEETVTTPTRLSYTPNITATLRVDNGNTTKTIPVNTAVAETRSWASRVIDGLQARLT